MKNMESWFSRLFKPHKHGSPKKLDQSHDRESTGDSNGDSKSYALQVNETGGVRLSVRRQEIESPSAHSSLNKIIAQAAEVSVKANGKTKIQLAIGGYDSDPRELYEIEDVCNWAKDILRRSPALYYFLDTGSKLRFVGWSLGPLTKSEIDSSEFSYKLLGETAVCGTKGASEGEELLKQFGADNSLIESIRAAEVIEAYEYSIGRGLRS